MEYSYKQINAILQAYSIEQLLEYNDMSPEEAVMFMCDEDFIHLPDIVPLDLEEE